MDARLRDVPLPAGLADRLRGIAIAADDDLDAAIRDVALPAGLMGRLERVARSGNRLSRIVQWATAVSLAIGIGLSYAGAMICLLCAIYPPPQLPRPELISYMTMQPSPGEEYINLLGDEDSVISIDGLEAGIPDADRRPTSLASHDPAQLAPPIELLKLDEPSAVRRVSLLNPFVPSPWGLGNDPLRDPTPEDWGAVFTDHAPFDELPELKKVTGLIPRGIDAPLVPGFDWSFFIRFGVHPFVSPAIHRELCSSVVPLGIDSASYELTRRHLEDGELPPPEAIRPEEFLAAIDYEFPPPKKQAMDLYVAGGPSPFRGGGLRLLQIGIRAAELGDVRRPGTHLTVAVDVSASMRWGGRLEMVRRALEDLLRRLGPDDRISLVVFSQDACVLGEDVSRDEADQLRPLIRSLGVQSSTNVGAGFRQAYAVAWHGIGPPDVAKRVVLLTDGLAELDRGTADRIERQLAAAAKRGIGLDVIDLGQVQGDKGLDPQLALFAAAGGGRLRPAASRSQVLWALLETLTGKSQLVAADARLKVTFNPQSVLGYRLLGHEAKAIAGLRAAHPQADFHAGQSATGLYELRLSPSGGDEVAVAELTWRDPQSGQLHRMIRKVGRDQFAPSLVQAPMSLQAAAVVAQTAEILRESPFTWISPGSGGLAQVLETARQLDTRLHQRPTFADFVGLVEQAERAKPFPRGGRFK